MIFSYKDLLYEAPEYIIKVKQYAKLLIEQKIWDSISHNDLDRWLSNFKTDEEILLSALLLESLAYRSAQQTTSLLIAALECALPHTIYSNPDEIFKGRNFLKLFTAKHADPEFKIVPVIRDSDSPTKSGPSVARMYRRQLGVNDKYMIWPWLIEKNIEAGAKNFVFIDDILATGSQSSEFFDTLKLAQYTDINFCYIPLLAHRDGIDLLKERHPSVKVSPVEVLEDAHCFFKNEKMAQIIDLKELYLKVAEQRMNRSFFKRMPMGYDGLALTFSYYHATPNASLPLFWYESESFHPLVRR